MKDNHPLASGENGILKSERQLLIEANQLIGQMTKERIAGVEHIEKMKWQIAQLRMGVAALATHFKLTPDEVRVIYDAYCDEQDKAANADVMKANEEAKAQFVADLKAGKKVEFKIVERENDAAHEQPVADAPSGEPDTEAKPEDN